MKIHSRTNSKGFTIVEVAIVLTIVGIIVGGIYVVFSSVTREKKLSDSRRQITDIVSGTRDYFSGHSVVVGTETAVTNMAASSDALMKVLRDDAQIFPNDTGCTTPNTNITCANPYNGNYTLSLLNVGGKYHLAVQTDNLPRDACIGIATSFGAATTTQQQTGFAGIKLTVGGAATYTPPMTPATVANGICTVATGNSFVLLFRL